MVAIAQTASESRDRPVAELVRELAQVHGVSYRRTPYDDFAETASRLVGDELPPPDETEDLLIALYRAGVITSAERTALLAQHIRQTSA